MWLIENASPLDVSDSRWTVLTTYQVPASTNSNPEGGQSMDKDNETEEEAEEREENFSTCRAQLVGYATLYRFTNPMRESRRDTLRLTQLLLLPRFQRQGHGEALMGCVSQMAEKDGEGESVLEVGVEDPCQGMIRLRDTCDIRRALEMKVFEGLLRCPSGAVPPPSFVKDLEDVEVERVRGLLRVTHVQVRRVWLALLLGHLELLAGGKVWGDEPTAKAYRLLVKRCLHSWDRDIQAIKDGEAKKAALEFQWLQSLASFAGALAHLKLCSRDDAMLVQERWRVKEREQELELEAEAFAKTTALEP